MLRRTGLLLFLLVFISCGNDNNTHPEQNKPPEIPQVSEPQNGAFDVPVPVDFNWLCSDNDGDTLHYDLYLSQLPDTQYIAKIDLPETYCQIDSLKSETKYYWQVRAKDAQDITVSPVWSFTSTFINSARDLPFDSYPENGSIDLPLQLSLNWHCFDSDDDDLTYDLYFGMNEVPGLLALNIEPPYPLLQLHDNTTYYWQIIVKDQEHVIAGDIWQFTTKPENIPPAQAFDPHPFSGTIDVDIATDLSWSAFDAENDSLSFDIYFGQNINPEITVSGYKDTIWSPDPLENDGIYFWKINVSDGEHITEGVLWNFRTQGLNYPPAVPHTPFPPDGQQDVSLNVILSWECEDQNDDMLIYDVYFGQNGNLTLVSEEQLNNYYEPQEMEILTGFEWKVIASDGEYEIESPIWNFQTANGNIAPLQPGNPYPDDDDIEISLYTNISWECSDPDNDPLTYDVYFGNSSPPPLVSTQQTEMSFQPPAMLIPETIYHWSITASDGEYESFSNLWSFATLEAGSNMPPFEPELPFPADESIQQSIDIELSWQCTDPDGDILYYDIYFGIQPNLELISENYYEFSFNPGLLGENTIYNWQIIAYDGQFQTVGDVWIFHTASDSVVSEMVFVPGAVFEMGDTHYEYMDNEQPVHFVELAPFLIGRYEVTQSLWQSVMGNNPAYGYGVGENYPVYNVAWLRALEFCNSLSELQGFDPCYTITGNSASCDFDANGYRLPTEAEWEWAARGAQNPPDYLYSGSDNINEVAVFIENSGGDAAPVGTKQPNQLNIYDLSGNIWEWCWDWYSDDYYQDCYNQGTIMNPTGAETGTHKIIRGGYFYSIRTNERVSRRHSIFPGTIANSIGIRIVRTAD